MSPEEGKMIKSLIAMLPVLLKKISHESGNNILSCMAENNLQVRFMFFSETRDDPLCLLGSQIKSVDGSLSIIFSSGS